MLYNRVFSWYWSEIKAGLRSCSMYNPGSGLFVGAFLLCGFATAFSLASLKLVGESARKAYQKAQRGILLAVLVLAGSFFCLVIAFITDDFSVSAVAHYSSAGLPLVYKVAAVWAGSQGSLLLWTSIMLCIFGLWFSRTRFEDDKLGGVFLATGAGVCLGFTGLCIFAANPFANCPVTLDDGMGLNPLLQNFWMVIHPPLLFAGYSALLMPFVLLAGWAILPEKMDESRLQAALRRWTLVGMVFLGMGIATGARWSYLELGWGGYWSWDPVENASLVPWLIAIAVLHLLAGGKVSGRLKPAAMALAPLPFVMCLLATFVTRSGLLRSVHAFAENPMSTGLSILIGLCSIMCVFVIVRVVRRLANRAVGGSGFRFLGRDGFLFWAALLLIVAAVLIAGGTFWPVISQICEKSGTKVELTRQFFDRIAGVIGVSLAILLGISALGYPKGCKGFGLRVLVCITPAGLCLVLLGVYSKQSLLISAVYSLCVFCLFSVLIELIERLFRRLSFGSSLTHFGFILLVIAAGASSNERNIKAEFGRGQNIRAGGYELVYQGFNREVHRSITKVGPEILLRKDGFEKLLWPHNNLYPDGNKTGEVAVHTTILKDIYLFFDTVDLKGNVVIDIKIKSGIIWIWIAMCVLVAGPSWAFIERRK